LLQSSSTGPIQILPPFDEIAFDSEPPTKKTFESLESGNPKANGLDISSVLVLCFGLTIVPTRNKTMVIPPSPGSKRKLTPTSNVPTGPTLPRANVSCAVAAEMDGKLLQQLFKLVNVMMRKLIDLSQAVTRTEEKIDRLMEAQDDRRVEELLENVVEFPINEKDDFTLLEEILTTGNNKVKLVRKLIRSLSLFRFCSTLFGRLLFFIGPAVL
jgi:hypothetical protein